MTTPSANLILHARQLAAARRRQQSVREAWSEEKRQQRRDAARTLQAQLFRQLLGPDRAA
mgnify:CR=1 FL=1